MNSGAARSSACQLIGVRRSRAARIGSSGRRSRSAWSARRRSCSTRFSASSAARRSGSSSDPTTPITREASRTWTVGCVYSGAMRTAVCCRDVVAPPTRSGSCIPRRSISLATTTISSSDGRDEPREPDDVAVLVDRCVEDRLGGNHHPQVDHLVAVAAEHDADDVLADVVDVAPDGRHDDAPRGARVPGLLGLHERLEVGDGSLHRAGALDDLRQEHAPRAEEVADDPHPVHQRALDHVERSCGRLARLLDVLLDEVDDPVHERVLEPLADRRLAPRDVLLPLDGRPLVAARELDEPLGRVGPAVPDDVLDVLEQLRLDVLVDHQEAGVDDAHVEAGADRVVEERRVHRLAHVLVAAEGERQVGDAAARPRAGAALLDERERLDERLRELVVLLDPRRDREHVRVEDDVLGREPRLLGQQVDTRARRSRPCARRVSACPCSSNAITTTPAP